MSTKHDQNSGREATALLASSVVVIGGLFIITLMGLAFANDPAQPLRLGAAYVFGIVLLFWLLRSRPQNESRIRNLVWMYLKKSDEAAIRYEPKRRRTREKQSESNDPPTAETIQELRGGLHTWVPSDRRN